MCAVLPNVSHWKYMEWSPKFGFLWQIWVKIFQFGNAAPQKELTRVESHLLSYQALKSVHKFLSEASRKSLVNKKIKTLKGYRLPMCREAPRNQTASPFSMWGQWPKVINCPNFKLSRSTSFCGLNTPEIPILIGIASGPYNSQGITMPCCDNYVVYLLWVISHVE